MASTTPVLPSAHPPLGTLIDNGAYELVEVLGIGGYGVVYRAIDARTPYPQSYAVKCLIHSPTLSQSRRNHHIREIALHQIASGHPGIVTLHKVVQDYDYTYIIIDYAPDHDLFTQILNNRRYLGDDVIIKHIFLQLLDAVEYIHSLGIYHRDLKPENILCFEDGYRVALTDFGLATTDKTSSEFRTGSVYHMSPECQGGEFAPTGIYSPRFNDIWSLGIILLNLATGRNPWKSATSSDPTFQAYLRDPYDFLPSVLPISPEINDILVRVLAVDWRKRMSLRQLRRAIENVDSFYSDDVVFEGSLARCPWEVVDFDPEARDEPCIDKCSRRRAASADELRSCWSDDTEDDADAPCTATTVTHGAPWSSTTDNGENGRPTWLAETLGLTNFNEDLDPYCFDAPTPPSTHSPSSPVFSDGPVTPNSTTLFGSVKRKQGSYLKLTINTALPDKQRYYENSDLASPETADEESLVSSPTSSMMYTAVEVSYPSSSVFGSQRVSNISLPTSESLPRQRIVGPDPKDTKMSAGPWNSPVVPVSSIASTDLSFFSRFPSTGESFQSVTVPDESPPETLIGPSVGSSDHVYWPDFCVSDGDDGGGGTSVEESLHGVAQENMIHPNMHDAYERARPGVVGSTPMQPRRQQDRRSSEPWLSDFFRLAKQPRQQYCEGELQHRRNNAKPAFDDTTKSQNNLPAAFQFDSQNSPSRPAKPWFLPARFFPVD